MRNLSLKCPKTSRAPKWYFCSVHLYADKGHYKAFIKSSPSLSQHTHAHTSTHNWFLTLFLFSFCKAAPYQVMYEWTEVPFIPRSLLPNLPLQFKRNDENSCDKNPASSLPEGPRTRPILKGMWKVGELSKIFMYGSRPKENSHAITNCGQRIIYQQTNAGSPECLSSNEIIYLWKPMPVLGPRPIYQAWEACGYAPGPLTFHLFPLVLQDETLPLILLPSLVHLPTECKCKAEGLRNNSKAMDQGHGYKSLPLALWLMQAVCHTWARWPLWHNREKYRQRSKEETPSTVANLGGCNVILAGFTHFFCQRLSPHAGQ